MCPPFIRVSERRSGCVIAVRNHVPTARGEGPFPSAFLFFCTDNPQNNMSADIIRTGGECKSKGFDAAKNSWLAGLFVLLGQTFQNLQIKG